MGYGVELEAPRDIALKLRADVLDMIHCAGSGHCGGSLSCIEILVALYFVKMNLDPCNPGWEDRDRFVASKGHCAPALYATLARRGFFPAKELANLRKMGHFLQGHPDMKKVPGVDMSTGSLGMGLSVGIGFALSARLRGRDYRTYVLLGDGELQEGQNWEAAMAAVKFNLSNLIAIVDRNRVQLDGQVDEIMPLGDVEAKWRAFGWNVVEADGHDVDRISEAIDCAKAFSGGPTVIIARTVKGKGVSFMEGRHEWHGKPLCDSDYESAIGELGVGREKSGVRSQESGAEGNAREVAPTPPSDSWVLDTSPVAIREAYGKALVELGSRNNRVVVLDADVSNSTRTIYFANQFPERFFNVGIAEANMMGIAAGLAAGGFVPFVNTFAFLTALRAADSVSSLVAYNSLNVKIAGNYAGLSDSYDGASHQSINDIAIMRSMPSMTVIVVADPVETQMAVEAVASHVGPVYLRLSRAEAPLIFDQCHPFEVGKGIVLREGTDVTIVATGYMVHKALEAAGALAQTGIDAEVIEIHTIKPIDEQLLIESAAKTSAVVTAEEHSVVGGLGSAVAEVLSAKCPTMVESVGIKDTYAESGGYEELLEKYEMSSSSIVETVHRALRKEVQR